MGYIGWSRSERAAIAYSRGERPLSKITASWLREAGWEHPVDFARYLAEQGFWVPSSWHHTGSKYRCTDFYNAYDLLNDWEMLDEEEKQDWINRWQESRSRPAESVPVQGTYLRWHFDGRRWWPEQVEFRGTLRGKWIYLSDGSKKKADAKGVEYQIMRETR